MTLSPQPAPVVHFPVLDSTNAEARRRAEAGEPGPVWISAAEQTAGRGRRGRAWSSPGGNLSATWLGLSDMAPVEAAEIAFVAAVAVADTLSQWVPPSLVRIKWPNDILIDGHKAAGILVESGRFDPVHLWLAVGIGINVAKAPDTAQSPSVFGITALGAHLSQDHSVSPEVATVLDSLCLAFEQRRLSWLHNGFASIRTAWLDRAHGLGQPCIARLQDEAVEGIALGLDEDGALQLRQADGRIRRITAGDVFFPEAA